MAPAKTVIRSNQPSIHRAIFMTRFCKFLLCLSLLTALPNHLPAGTTRAHQAVTPPKSTQDQTDPAIIAPALALKLALERLQAEAQDFRQTGRIEILKSDFAQRFEHQLNPADVLHAVRTVQDPKDGSRDAYIRWQLLSFKPDLSNLSTTEFEAFVRTLPSFTKHPAHAETLHAELEELAKYSGRSAEIRQRLQKKWEALQIQVRQFEVLNFPAVEFRTAVTDLLPDTGPQRIVFFLYDLRDRIQAGLATRSIKSKITRELKRRRLDDSLSADQRWQLIQQIENMAKADAKEAANETKIIRDITFYNTAPADIHYSVLTIRTNDVKNWTNALNRIE